MKNTTPNEKHTVIDAIYNGTAKPTKLKPLEVDVKEYDRFDNKVRMFTSLVQKEKVLAILKEKSRYEKPSAKKRRKAREAVSRKFAAELLQKLIDSGEFEKRQEQKEKRRAERRGKKDE